MNSGANNAHFTGVAAQFSIFSAATEPAKAHCLQREGPTLDQRTGDP